MSCCESGADELEINELETVHQLTHTGPLIEFSRQRKRERLSLLCQTTFGANI